MVLISVGDNVAVHTDGQDLGDDILGFLLPLLLIRAPEEVLSYIRQIKENKVQNWRRIRRNGVADTNSASGFK